MLVRVVRGVLAQFLEHVLQVVGDEVHAHEEEEHAHREAGEDFGALESERVPDAGALPHLEVGEHVDDHAQHGTEGVEEYEVGECGEGQRAGRAPERVGCDGHVADGPVETLFLLGGHAAPAFGEGGYGEGGWQRNWGAGSGLEEDLVGDAAVFVFVAAPLANALEISLVNARTGGLMDVLTDFVMGDFASDIGWKLKGPFPFCMDSSLLPPLLSVEMEL